MNETANNIPTLDGLLRVHERIRADLRTQLDGLIKHEAELRAQLERCVVTRAQIEQREKALDATEAMYREMLSRSGAPDAITSDRDESGFQNLRPAETSKLRARIGPQRYQMHIALREFGPLSQEQIADLTGFTMKRIRDQMVSDMDAGVVSCEVDKYRLTASGLDLLTRFEAYKRQRGERLPSLGERVNEADDSGAHDIGGITGAGTPDADQPDLIG